MIFLKVNFADGVEIVIDDDKLLNWEQTSDKRYIKFSMKNGEGLTKFKVDLQKKEIINYTQER